MAQKAEITPLMVVSFSMAGLPRQKACKIRLPAPYWCLENNDYEELSVSISDGACRNHNHSGLCWRILEHRHRSKHIPGHCQHRAGPCVALWRWGSGEDV
jgi:hypothetical protein